MNPLDEPADPDAAPARRSLTPEERRLVVLVHTNHELEALSLSSLLEQEGIPATVDGVQLADEFAVATRMAGMSSCSVKVPAFCLEQARSILAEARRQGELLGDSVEVDDRDAERPSPPDEQEMPWAYSFFSVIMATVATLTFVAILVYALMNWVRN